MNNIMRKLNEKLTPIASFCQSETHLASMQKGFMVMIAFIMVGAVFVIIANPPVTEDMINSGGFWSIFRGWYNFATANKTTILIPYNMTMGMLSVIAAGSIAYYLAHSYNMSALTAALTSIIVFCLAAAPGTYYPTSDGSSYFLGMNMTYLGAQGLLTAILISIMTVEITRLCQEKGFTIKLAKEIPASIGNTFNSLIPLLINVLIVFGANLLIGHFNSALSIPSFIEMFLGKPLGGLVNSLPGVIVICLLTLVFWTVGVHGNMIMMPFTTPVTMIAFADNAARVAAGQAPVLEPILLMNAINLLGGTGNTLSFVILCLKAKSKQLKAFGDACIVPAVFRISEPVIFGAPIVYNPILFIPFILSGMIPVFLYWLCCTLGWITPMYLLISGTFPIFINSFIKCLDWRMIVFEAVMIPLLMVVWYPFFRIYDDSLLKQEAAADAENAQ
jgi:PTS system cellobiose-specific IIC component